MAACPGNVVLIINEFRCYEVKIEESEKAGSHRESNQGPIYGLSHQSSATEQQQPDNHQPLQSCHSDSMPRALPLL